MSQVFTCPRCGAPQDYKGGSAATIECPYCGTTLIVPEELRTASPDFSAFNATDWGKQASALVEIKRLVDEGNEIAAIKLYRETFGTGLKESKDAVEAIQRGQNVQMARISFGEPSAFEINTPRGDIQINTSGGDGQTSTSPQIIEINQSRSGLGGALGTGVLIILVIVILAAILIPLGLASRDLFTTFQSATPVPEFLVDTPRTPTSIAFHSPTAPATRTSAPTVTSTPGFASIINSFGKAGTAPAQFKDARLIAIGQNGDLFIGEYSSARIQRFTADGQFRDQWTLNPKSPLTGLAADFRGNVYAVQAGVITKFNGATGEKIGTLNYSGGNRFDDVVTTPDGGVLATWYEQREGFITSVEGHRDDLVRFDRNGKVTQVIQGIISSQTDDPELNNKLAVDGQGNIYVLGGTFGAAVFKFSPDGKFVNRFGSQGTDPGQFNAPNAIATDGQGRVYVSFSNNVAVFAPDGRYLDTIQGVQGAAFGIAFDADDHLWVVTINKVYEFALNK
ncbi:MAG TPA: hypothetical protein VFD70_13760 [Anaerolineae bacterium]|nr:hypothetical protein [Anaerolineae bacterium]